MHLHERGRGGGRVKEEGEISGRGIVGEVRKERGR